MPKPSSDPMRLPQQLSLPVLSDTTDGSDHWVAGEQRMAFVLSLRERGISDVALLRALETVPREMFVPHHFADLAWREISLPIACGQTMPQPYAVARTMAALEIEPQHRVLEIGTGSGYATSILAQLAGEVITCERFKSLAHAAQSRLDRLQLKNVTLRWANGFDVPADAGSFDRVLIDAAINEVPRGIVSALAPGGLILFPRVGKRGSLDAGLYSLRRTPAGMAEDFLFAGRFTPAIPGRSVCL